MRNTPGLRIWQRNYYDQIVRSEESLHYIRQYIHNNPLFWQQDPLHYDEPDGSSTNIPNYSTQDDFGW